MSWMKIEWISNMMVQYPVMPVVTLLIAVAAVLTAFMPSITNHQGYNIVMKILNSIAFNIKQSKSADDAKLVPEKKPNV